MLLPILIVKDVEASIAFYTEKLGFEKQMAMEGPDGKTVFAFVALGDVQIGLDTDPASPRGGGGVDFMVYLPAGHQIDEAYRSVQARGVTIAAPLSTKYWGDRTFSLHDPDGYRITISQTVKEVPMDEIADIMRTGGNSAQ